MSLSGTVERSVLEAQAPKRNSLRKVLCALCGTEFMSAGRAAKYCDHCSPVVYRERSKQRQRVYARAKGIEILGSIRACLDCKSPFEMRGARHVRCDRCSSIHRRNDLNRRSEARARAAGVQKRTKASCRDCGRDFLAMSVLNRYCRGCSALAEKRRTAERDRERVLAAGGVPIGYESSCENCGSSFTKASGPEKYCSPCAETYLSRWRKAKLASDAKYAVNMRVSRAIRLSLTAGGKRGKKLKELVGYTIDDLMRHLERQFLPGMTWQNRGDWHIDHIVPLSSFRFTSADDPEFRAAWALTNLRPLWAKDNLEKRAQRIFLI